MNDNTKRLEIFTEAIMKVARGDFSVQVPISDEYDQIDALGMGINMMIDDLKLKDETEKENHQIKLLNKELTAARLKAEESERLKMAFLANMSHEIRTPMNGILGFADILKDSSLSKDRQQEFIGLIEKSGMRMLELINDIVDISRIESKTISKNIASVQINKLLDTLYNFFVPEASKKGIRLNLHKSLTDFDAVIDTDRRKFEAVLANLIKNAIKYTNCGQIEFGYDVTNINDKLELEFFVRDTGMGIPKEDCEYIFDRFARSKMVDNNTIEGTWLGLAISKAYVEILDGKIWVESEEGKGSVFYFTLPVDKDSKIRELVNEGKRNIALDSSLGKFKVLVVEDDPTAEYLLKIILERLTDNVLFAHDGKEAIDLFKRNPDISLILMDISLPVIRGDVVVKMIRKTNKSVPIIAQTAYCMEGDKERFLEIGCNDYLQKPILKDELIRIIKKYMEEVAFHKI